MQPYKSTMSKNRARPSTPRHLLTFALPVVVALVLIMCSTGTPRNRAMAAPAEQQIVLAIGYPQEGATVSGVVTIQGTATAPDFLNYSVYYAAGNHVHGETPWRYDDPIIDFIPTMIVNGVLGEWDTTRIPNGQYVLALAVRQSTTTDVQVAFVNNLTVYNEPATPTPAPTATPGVEEPQPADATPTGELPPVVGATIELPPTATPRPTPTLAPEEMATDGANTDDEGGLFSGDLFSVKAIKEAFTLGVQMAFLLYAIGILYMLTKAVIRYYLRQQSRGRSGS